MIIMIKKKTFTKSQLEKLTAEEVIDKIQHDGYSLLTTLGAEDLRKEMVNVGRACNTAVNYFFRTTGPKNDIEKHNQAASKKLVRVLSKITPGSYKDMPKDSKNGLVIGFSHPSLGEIARILMMKMDVMGDKPMLFPVNLPWYEALATDYDRIRQLGIIITPTITPSTWAKMNLRKGTAAFEAGSRLKREFRNLYTRLSHDTVKEGGVIFVAPSATRQATVFASREVYDKKEPIIPTMSVLALELFKDPKMKCDFLPLAVLPPKGYKRGLNFRKKYQLIPGEIIKAEEVRKKYIRGRKDLERMDDFDYDFHKKIADKLPREFWY